MPLNDHMVENDKFEFQCDSVLHWFPCVVCKYRDSEGLESVCEECDHNPNPREDRWFAQHLQAG